MTPREKLLKKFTEEYNRLNEHQRRAVDRTDGPVMVIAGPGTGKTQILSARIGRILLSEGGVEPSNILCLTYTDAGAVAMRRRLAQFIGPDAYRVHLATFHAFCNDVIQDNLGLFEKTALDPLSDLERIELMKELIDGFGKEHPLKRYRGDVYFEIGPLTQLFSLMKREGWTGDFICNKVDEYINDLQHRDDYICKRATKEYKKGDVRWDKIEEQKEKMEKLRAACNEAKKFGDLMRNRNRYDFDDMIGWVIDAFQTDENLLRSYQEKYQYILVDEYQDTSGSQNKIVQLLINYWDKPNVFVVGDDDQSIYRFQGANVENMLQFAEGFQKDLLTVVLVNNYRSTQAILDVSKTLIDNNDERLVKQIEGLSKDLISSKAQEFTSSRVERPEDGSRLPDERITGLPGYRKNGLTDSPTLYEYNTVREEMIGTVLMIEELLHKNVPGAEIGVIYRENKYGEDLAAYLRLKKIPYFSKRSLNILDQPLIKQLLLVLDYLRAEHDTPYGGDEMLFEILHFQWFDVPAIEIAKASMRVAELQYKNIRTSLRAWLCEEAAMPQRTLFDTGLHKGLKEASRIMEGLIGAVPNHTVQTLLEKLVREAGFLSHIIRHEEKVKLMQFLTGFYDHLKEETRRNPALTLEAFLNRLDLMRKEGIVLPFNETTGNERGVNLMTAHGSKGLEFEHVFFVNNSSAMWEKKRKPYNGFSFPDTLFSSSAKGNDTEELRRLFYVALTRAKKHLNISYPNYTADKKNLEPSMFLAEIQQAHDLPLLKKAVDEGVLTEFAVLQFKKEAPEVAPVDDDVIDRIVQNFSMNASALNAYLKCPLGFYYQYVVRIPSPRNEAMAFGSAVHYALESLFNRMKKAGEFPLLDDFLQDFSWHMHRHRESFTKEQFYRRKEYGLEILKNYYNTYITRWNKVVLVELNVRSVQLDGIPMKGKIDKIEFSGKEATLVDYKTGDPEKCGDKFARPGKEPHGGDYWRQAVFYKILLDLYPKEWNVAAVEFDFVEPDKKKQYRKEAVSLSIIDIELVKAQIKDVYAKVQGRQFYKGCGKEDCHWCNFVKTNKLHVALHEIMEEEEARRPFLKAV